MAAPGTTADAEDILEALDTALIGAQAAGVRAIQKQGKTAASQMVLFHTKQKYANESGAVVPLRPFSAAWGNRKAQLGLDPKRGHASLGLSKAIKSPKNFVKLKDGFRIDLLEGAFATFTKIRTRMKGSSQRGRKRLADVSDKGTPAVRRVRVLKYIRHYEKSKAPGLGSLTKKQFKIIERKAEEAVEKKLSRVRRSARKAGRFFQIELNLKIDRLNVK